MPDVPLTDAEIIRGLGDDLPLGIWVARCPAGEFVHANRAFAEIMGVGARSDVAAGEYSVPYGIHNRAGDHSPEDRLPFVLALQSGAEVTVDDLVIHRHDGRKVNIRATARPVRHPSGALSHIVVAFIDISREVAAETQRAESEARLARAQRMESIGNLAGGVAHDFNNLLAAIKLIASRLNQEATDAETARDLALIEQVADRAVELTRSLLGFAGRGKNLSQVVPLHRVLSSVSQLARRTFDPRIDVTTAFEASNGAVVGDLGQLEQVFMNLAVNARDAMPDGGSLTLRTRDEACETATEANGLPLRPGRYVVVEVADTGTGIAPAIRERVFDPYFTTKTSGEVRGTGLGLATVYGIVASHDGAIEVVDNVPHGTLFRLFLPSAAESSIRETPDSPPEFVPGQGCVLVVEDDATVRRAAKRSIERLGYTVLEAADGVEGEEIFASRHAEIDVVLLDMRMPRQDGRTTYLAMRAIDARVRVILTTGFALNEEAQNILNLGVEGFIAKPYDIHSLSVLLAGAGRPQ